MSFLTPKSAEIKRRYEEWHSKGRDCVDEKFFSWLIKNVKREHQSDGLVLDVACGKRLWTSVCQDVNIDSIGIDISRIALAEAKEKDKASIYLLADGENLPFRGNSFDVITCLGSLEHFSNPDKGAREIARLLKDTGKAFVMLPNLYFLGHIYLVYKTGEPPDEGGQQFSERFSTKKGWERMLNDNGLKVVKCLKYNHISKASQKVSSVARSLFNLINSLVPVNLSYAFLYVCKKAEK